IKMMFQHLSIAIVLATTTYVTIVSAQGNSNNTRASTVRAVKPWDDIAAAIESDAVDAKATYTISASQVDFGQDAILPPDVEASIEETTFTFEVNVATPAVTADTLIQDEDGNLVRMGELAYSLLVPSATDRESGTMALISVDHKTGEANGIVQKTGSGAAAMHIRQKKGRSIVAEEEAEFVPPAWECTVAEEHEEDPHHHHDHDHGLDGNDLPGSFEHLRKSLRGADVSKIGKRRKLQDSNLPYSYQVDLYIEFDQKLVQNNGGSIQNTYNYINSLVTMANQIYEYEVDTHLNVFQMELTTRYNNIKNTMDGLNIMRNNWAGNKWSNSQVDLHHALLGKPLGGGVAYVGVVCNKNYGMGVSTSISGSFSSMGAGVVWDSMVFTHEIGHNFASGHTFNGYDPPVDTCMRNSKCPSGGIEDDSATLMSYCHRCGGFKKVEYTFGGEYDGSGSKSLVSNWKKSEKLEGTTASVEPQRVPHKMYQHISSRGSCVAVPAPVGPTPTQDVPAYF
ncbi:hypothetical protein ACHAWT_004627, partial [Skeletonema menzelii]